jgi:hypothetical protein
LLHCQKDLAEEKTKFQKLKEDFKYNLRLLAERDAELEQYDTSAIGWNDLRSSLWLCIVFIPQASRVS